MFKKIVLLKSSPTKTDAGLLLLRLIVATSIFIKHAVEKIFGFSTSVAHLAASHHYVAAIGPGPSLFCAAVSDGLLSVFIVLGFATRWSAFLSMINLSVAWIVIGTPYAGHQVTGTSGEMIISYIAAMACLSLTGGGRYSLDALLNREAVSSTRMVPVSD